MCSLSDDRAALQEVSSHSLYAMPEDSPFAAEDPIQTALSHSATLGCFSETSTDSFSGDEIILDGRRRLQTPKKLALTPQNAEADVRIESFDQRIVKGHEVEDDTSSNKAHVRVHIPDLYNEEESLSQPFSGRYSSISPEDYFKDLRAYNNRYQPGDSSYSEVLDDSVTSNSSRMYAIYSARNPQSQTLTLHHSNYPTRNLECFGIQVDGPRPQFVSLNDVRVEWSYSRRDLRGGGTGVLGDMIQPYRTHNGAVVAPSYQQIEGVGCERGREWTGRPLIKGFLRDWILSISILALSVAFLIFVFMLVFEVSKVDSKCYYRGSEYFLVINYCLIYKKIQMPRVTVICNWKCFSII